MTTPKEKPSLELIVYRLDEQKHDLQEIKQTLTTMGDTYVPRTEIQDKFKTVHRRIDDIEANITWLARTIIGAIIAAILAAIGLSR